MDIIISSNFERILAESLSPEDLSNLYQNIYNKCLKLLIKDLIKRLLNKHLLTPQKNKI